MFFYTNEKHLQEIKQKLHSPSGEYKLLRVELELAAEKQFTRGPWSVTFSKSGAISGNPNDYFSVAPYWWPDPNAANPDTAPYIRRDGEVTPERFKYHHRQDLGALGVAFQALVTAGYMLDERRYLDRAAELLNVWFIDLKTSMNPHLEYAQAIKNICNGRGIGIIEMHPIDSIIRSIGLLEAAGGYDETISGFKSWLNRFLDWLLTSSHGLEESRNGNNHETRYNVHIGLFGFWLGRYEILDIICDNYKSRMVPQQIEPDGAMIRELGRTSSFIYSMENLNALAEICELAHIRGVDLWTYKHGDRCIEAAIDYMLPGIKNPHNWRFPEIRAGLPQENFTLQFAAMRLNRPELLEINKSLRIGKRYLNNYLFLLDGYGFDDL